VSAGREPGEKRHCKLTGYDFSPYLDLSSSTASAMDLTLTYYLTKAHLGSLALEPEYNASASVAKAASKDTKLLQVQAQMINAAKSSALAAMNLAISQVGFRDRLVYLPGYYHFVSLWTCLNFKPS